MFTIMIIEDNELIRNEIHNLLDLNKYKTIKGEILWVFY